MKKVYVSIIVLLVGLLLSGCRTKSDLHTETAIYKNNKIYAEIIISKKPTRSVKLAARELADYLYKITGKNIKVSSEPNTNYPIKLYVGRSKQTDRLKLKNANFEHGAFRITSGKNWIAFIGNDKDFKPKEPYGHSRGDLDRVMRDWDKITNAHWGNPYTHLFKAYNKKNDIWENDNCGSLNAVHEYLRMLGVRWFMPGELGEVVPKKKVIELSVIDKIVKPDFKFRWLAFWAKRFYQTSDEELMWYLRMGLNRADNLLGHGTLGHGIINVHSRPEFKSAHPDYFALFNGRRDTDSRKAGKPCLSSKGLRQENIKFARFIFDHYDEPAISIMPPDAYSYVCEGNLCKGKDTPERGFKGQISDYVWGYVNEVAKELYKSHPNKKVICFAYGAYLLPPESIKQLSPNVIVGICRTRSRFVDPKEKQFYAELRSAWNSKVKSKQFLTWDYYLHTRKGKEQEGIPVVFPNLIQEDLKSLKSKSLGEFIEVYRDHTDRSNKDLAINHLNTYVTSKLYWNVNQDLDALLKDYYSSFYGPASNEMQKFFNFSEVNWHQMSKDPTLITKAFDLLNNALKKVKSGNNKIFKQRIELVYEYIKPMKEINSRLRSKRVESNITKAIDKRRKTLKVDGLLKEGFWERMPNYLLGGSTVDRKDKIKTYYKIAWAEESVFFGIDAINLSRKRSKGIESLDLLLATQNFSFYHVKIEPVKKKVILTDSKGKMLKVDLDYAFSFSKEDNSWSLELEIPVKNGKALEGRKPNKTYPWTYNLRRCTELEGKTIYSYLNQNSLIDFFDSNGFSTLYVK